jgi:hypothetical protein
MNTLFSILLQKPVIPTAAGKTAALIFMTLLMTTTVRHNARHGYADNGDYIRLSQIIAARPHGFSSALTTRDNRQQWERRYFRYWLPAWECDDTATLASTYISSAWPFIRTAKLVSCGTAAGSYDITAAGLLVNLLVYVILAYATFRAGTLHSAILYLLFYAVFTQNGYQLFASTFYADFYALAGFLLFAVFFAEGTVFPAVLAAVASIAKTQMVFMAVPAWFAFKDKRTGAAVIALAAVAIVFLAGTRGKGGPDVNDTRFNDVNRIFCGALVVSRQPLDHLAALGFDNQTYRIGRSAFKGNADIVGKVTARDFARIVAREPLVLPRMLAAGIGPFGGPVVIPYLGVSAYPGGAYTAPVIMQVRDRVFGNVLCGWLTVPCIIAALGMCVLLYIWKERAMANLLFMLVTGVVLSYVTTVIGDGFYELQKHLVITNFIYDLLRVTLLVDLAYVLARAIRRTKFDEAAQATIVT